jgi:serine/threonine-protein kinase RsbW
VNHKNECKCQPAQKYTLHLQTEITLLNEVLTWFDQFNYPPVPEIAWMQCQLALAEAFTNAVRHAHKGLPSDTPIDLEVSILCESLEIRIWDCGPGLDLPKKLHELSQHRDKDAEGGRGLRLIELIADYMSYTKTEDDRNCFLIVKQYSKC